jgi:hypothetical protein
MDLAAEMRDRRAIELIGGDDVLTASLRRERRQAKQQ